MPANKAPVKTVIEGNSEGFDFATFADAYSIAAAAERAGQSHGATGALIRNILPDLRADALNSSMRGDRIAMRLARNIDKVILTLFHCASAPSSGFAICAVGGYGRAWLAPYSDIDLLFLHDERGQNLNAIIDPLLYPLWDSGLKIGHSVHTPKSAIEFAGSDMIARTAFLDSRFLCGDDALLQSFADGYEKLRKRTIKAFVAAKLQEQDDRQTKSDETRYLVEPDIKDGKGGLRDVHTIHWIYKYAFEVEFNKATGKTNIFSEGERRSLKKAARFLWSVRTQLHDIVGRSSEHLTFEVQPEVAKRLGYAARPGMSAAERLMKHYFINAVEVGRLTRILCARLEAAKAKRIPSIPKLLPKAMQADELPGKPNLRIRNGRLDFQSATKARRNPRDLFRLFRAFSKNQKIDFHPDALAIVAEQTPNVTIDVRRDRAVCDLFAGILTQSHDPVRVLRLMTETGLLGKFIPAFGSVVGRIQYGLYRRYTIDEHILRSIGVLVNIRAGKLTGDHPISSRLVAKSNEPLLFFVALLLHEANWTVKNRSPEATEKLVRRVGKRLGLTPENAALAGWAAANHLYMVRIAERRNLTETGAIARFASAVGDKRRLDLALVLSVCHLRVVAHDSWDNVTARQLTELYEASSIWIEHGTDAVEARLRARAEQALSETQTRLANWSKDETNDFLPRLTDNMLRAVDPDILARFAHLAKAASHDNADAAVTITPRDDGLEAVIYADDRPGLLGDLAAAIAARGLNVRSVQALTAGDGKVFDIFYVQALDNAEINDVSQIRRLHSGMLDTARATPSYPLSINKRLGDRRSLFTVKPVVGIENDESDAATVVETEGLDRPGLLFELASALTELGAVIVSAHIATYGERAVDSFYVQDANGEKITDKKALAAISAALTTVLSAGPQG